MRKPTTPCDSEISAVVAAVAQRLQSRAWTLVTAESCTGGWIAKCCTDLAGSSAWFSGGFVSYSNEAKIEMLGVSVESLESQGAVSERVVAGMAQGARKRSGAEVSLAVTGVAGPGGGSQEKPIGTVWFGWSVAGQDCTTQIVNFAGDRDRVRRQTVFHALKGLLAVLGLE